jgi:hypothetical protein
MRSAMAVLVALAAWAALVPADAMAQRGAGQPQGVARLAERPETVTLAGKLAEIKSGPCEDRVAEPALAPIGTHLFLETSDGTRLNVHLGPARTVQGIVRQLKVGQELTVTAFRTGAMAEGHYVAQVIAAGDREFELRDEALRPVWAGGRGQGQGRGPAAAPGAGQGPGLGRGPGPAWGGGGMGRGQGRGPARGAGPGWGAGQGRGARW